MTTIMPEPEQPKTVDLPPHVAAILIETLVGMVAPPRSIFPYQHSAVQPGEITMPRDAFDKITNQMAERGAEVLRLNADIRRLQDERAELHKQLDDKADVQRNEREALVNHIGALHRAIIDAGEAEGNYSSEGVVDRATLVINNLRQERAEIKRQNDMTVEVGTALHNLRQSLLDAGDQDAFNYTIASAVARAGNVVKQHAQLVPAITHIRKAVGEAGYKIAPGEYEALLNVFDRYMHEVHRTHADLVNGYAPEFRELCAALEKAEPRKGNGRGQYEDLNAIGLVQAATKRLEDTTPWLEELRTELLDYGYGSAPIMTNRELVATARTIIKKAKEAGKYERTSTFARLLMPDEVLFDPAWGEHRIVSVHNQRNGVTRVYLEPDPKVHGTRVLTYAWDDRVFTTPQPKGGPA